MKRTSKILLIPLVAFLIQGTLKSQSDSLSAKDSYLNEYRNSKLYRFFQMDKEEKFMIKFGGEVRAFPNSIEPSSGYTLFVGAEIKLKPSFSINNAFNIRVEENSEYGISTAFNYYFNLSKRIFEGRSANNFSADYIKLELQNGIRDYPMRVNDTINNIPFYLETESNWKYEPYVVFGYGIQRRLKKMGFFDFSIFSRYGFLNQQVDLLGLSLKIGFGLPKVKKNGN